jgi:hypothetical protein
MVSRCGRGIGGYRLARAGARRCAGRGGGVRAACTVSVGDDMHHSVHRRGGALTQPSESPAEDPRPVDEIRFVDKLLPVSQRVAGFP